MDQLRDNDERKAIIRAIETELLGKPHPEDPFVTFPKNYIRAASLSKEEWDARSSQIHRATTRSSSHRRHIRRHRDEPRQEENRLQEEDVGDDRRPLSPTDIPGVRAIPKEYNRVFRGLLSPGEYFAKSRTRYLGPFLEMPTEDSLPAGDSYIILQRMGRLPDSGKSIFRQVGNIVN